MSQKVKTMSVTLNANLLANLTKYMESALDTALTILEMVPDKKKLSDASEKFAHIRAERIAHTACEFLDGKSYGDVDEASKKADGAYRKSIARIKANVAK